MHSPRRGRRLDFVCVGAPRCATTSLYDVMRASEVAALPHPQKETHFFDAAYDRGFEWYWRHFPRRGLRWGEIAPSYLRHPDVPSRLQAHNPHLRIVLLLRHPVSRALSHFYYMRQNGADISVEALRTLDQDPTDSSRYATHVQRLLAHFPREQVLYVIFERLVTEPQGQLDRIARFLNLETGLRVDRFARTNTARTPRWAWAWKLARRARARLYQRDLRHVVGFGKALGVGRLLGGSSPPDAPPADELRAHVTWLAGEMRSEVDRLSALTSLDFGRFWHFPPSGASRAAALPPRLHH